MGLAYCGTFCNEQEVSLRRTIFSLLSTVIDRFEDSSVRLRLVVGLYLWVCRLLFSLLALVECRVVFILLDIRCSAHHLFSRRCLFDGWLVGVSLLSYSTSFGQGVHSDWRQLCEVRTQVQREKGWKDRRIKSPLSAWFSISGRRGLSLFFPTCGLCLCLF